MKQDFTPPPRVQKVAIGGMHEGHVASPQGARASTSTSPTTSINNETTPPAFDPLFDVTPCTCSHVLEHQAKVEIMHNLESMQDVLVTFCNDDNPNT